MALEAHERSYIHPVEACPASPCPAGEAGCGLSIRHQMSVPSSSDRCYLSRRLCAFCRLVRFLLCDIVYTSERVQCQDANPQSPVTSSAG